jgi:hypothetical protein
VGVNAIVILFILLGLFAIFISMVYFGLAESQVSSFTYTSLGLLYQLSLGYTIPSGLTLTTLEDLLYWQSALPTAYTGVGAAVIIAALFFITDVGLLRMKSWGRILALILGILSIIGGAIGLIAIGSYLGIIPLIFGIIAVAYLFSGVKNDFE